VSAPLNVMPVARANAPAKRANVPAEVARMPLTTRLAPAAVTGTAAVAPQVAKRALAERFA